MSRRMSLAVVLAGLVVGTVAGGTVPAQARDGAAALSVVTSVDRPQAAPGTPIRQTTVVRSTGTLAALALVVDMGGVAGCRRPIPSLPPGRSASVSCAGVVAAGTTVLTATVTGIDPHRNALFASASVQLQPLPPASPSPAAPAPRPAPAPPPAPPATPPPAGAPPAPPAVPEPPPAVPGPPQAVAAPPPAAAPLPQAAPPPLPPPPPAAQPARPVARAGPLAAPARTAAVVAVLGVFVMTVSVGALSAALRVR